MFLLLLIFSFVNYVRVDLMLHQYLLCNIAGNQDINGCSQMRLDLWLFLLIQFVDEQDRGIGYTNITLRIEDPTITDATKKVIFTKTIKTKEMVQLFMI